METEKLFEKKILRLLSSVEVLVAMSRLLYLPYPNIKGKH